MEALGCYDRSLGVNPRYAKVWLNKGTTLFTLGNLKEAIGCYDKGIEISPGFADAWYGKGTALLDLENIPEAVHCFQKFIEHAPPDSASRAEQVQQLINQLK